MCWQTNLTNFWVFLRIYIKGTAYVYTLEPAYLNFSYPNSQYTISSYNLQICCFLEKKLGRKVFRSPSVSSALEFTKVW